MHKKFQTQLQDYLKDLTAMGDPTPEPETQQDTKSDGVQAEEQSPASHSLKKQNSPKKSLSLPSFSSLGSGSAVSPQTSSSASHESPSNGSPPSSETAIDGEDAMIDTAKTIAGERNLPGTQTTKPRKIQKRWLLGGAFLLAIAGTVLALPKAVEMVEQWRQEEQIKTYEQEQDRDSEVLRLALLPPAERDAKLQAITAQPTLSLERSRARYLLAEDLLGKYEGGPAVKMLENLEVDYPILGPYVLLMRGRGYQLSNENIKAQETWLEILEKYPDSPLVVNALANLGTLDEAYWQRAIADYPNHPRTLDILHQKLAKSPGSAEIKQQILRINPTDNRTAKIIDQLLENNQDQLTPEDWQAIGDNYWQRRIYNKAIAPYEKAPKNPQNLYRLARSQQLSDLKDKAETNYQTLISTYPDAPETATALQRLAGLVPPAEGVKYLQQWAQKFPDQGAEALAQEIDLLTKFDAVAAQQARQRLLENYSDSDAAANYRWRQAKEFAKGGNLTEAWQWAREIASQNPHSEVAPKAVFWIGKWAQQLGRPDDAKAAFENVLARYPQSYYAWRSAVLLGWQVGDFNTVRFLNPPVTVPSQRPIPPAGSATFKELFRLAQDQAAIELFEAELQAQKSPENPSELPVNEGFTQALLKLTQQEYLQGINQVLNLRDPQDPEQRKAWEALRETPEYWQALFPFPYKKLIFDWSAKRQLNPFLVTALIRQESRFEKEIKSPAGATGLMQVMPSTAEWIAPQINLKDYSLTDPTDNVNMGTWYFDHTHQTYNNNSALAVASYNAGPGNVSKWLAEFDNADPDAFVEKIPFRETKGYVESVFGNYWNYLRIYDPDVQQLMSRLPKP
jgi:soluble lytic murein transglycosylase